MAWLGIEEESCRKWQVQRGQPIWDTGTSIVRMATANATILVLTPTLISPQQSQKLSSGHLALFLSSPNCAHTLLLSTVFR